MPVPLEDSATLPAEELASQVTRHSPPTRVCVAAAESTGLGRLCMAAAKAQPEAQVHCALLFLPSNVHSSMQGTLSLLYLTPGPPACASEMASLRATSSTGDRQCHL
jgi:hypothetical protein